jgi:hypothetical protein
MHIRYIVGALLVSIFVTGSPPLPASNTHSGLAALVAPMAEAKNLREKARSLLDRVLGESMPEGIVKTNGRIEAIQVDVAAKYPGRLVDITRTATLHGRGRPSRQRRYHCRSGTWPHGHARDRIYSALLLDSLVPR